MPDLIRSQQIYIISVQCEHIYISKKAVLTKTSYHSHRQTNNSTSSIHSIYSTEYRNFLEKDMDIALKKDSGNQPDFSLLFLVSSS